MTALVTSSPPRDPRGGASRFLVTAAEAQRWELVSCEYCAEETRRNLPKLPRATGAWERIIAPRVRFIATRVSLDQPLGESDDGAVGEFVRDQREDDPLKGTNQAALKSSIARALDGRQGRRPVCVVPGNVESRSGTPMAEPLSDEAVAAMGRVVLEITVERCAKAPPEETPESAAFLVIRDIKPEQPPVELFRGWMMASSPALSALEHPVYDVWVKDCRNAK